MIWYSVFGQIIRNILLFRFWAIRFTIIKQPNRPKCRILNSSQKIVASIAQRASSQITIAFLVKRKQILTLFRLNLAVILLDYEYFAINLNVVQYVCNNMRTPTIILVQAAQSYMAHMIPINVFLFGRIHWLSVL